jgi:hypothetical protein
MPRKKQIPRATSALGMTKSAFFRSLYSLSFFLCNQVSPKPVLETNFAQFNRRNSGQPSGNQ